MFLALQEHHPWYDFTVVHPVMAELMPPFLENDFVLADLIPPPQLIVRIIETTR